MSRRHPLLEAFERDALGPDDPRWAEVAGDDEALRALAGAQLDALGHGTPGSGDIDPDAIALAALGLGPGPVGLSAADEAFIDALRDGAPGELAPAPSASDSRAAADDGPMTLSPPTDPEALADVFGAAAGSSSAPAAPAVVVPIVAGAVVPPRRRSWAPWAGAFALAAALGLTVVTTQLMLTDDDGAIPVTADEAPAAAKAVGAGDEVAGADPNEAPAADQARLDGAGAERAAAKEKAAEGAAAEEAAAEEAAEEKAAADDGALEGPGRPAGASDRPDTEDAPPAAAAPSPARPRAARRGRPAAAKPKPPAAVAARPARKAEATRRKPAPRKKESSDDVDALLGALDGGGSKPAGGGRPAPAAAPVGGDPMLPEQLTRRQILTVVKRNARSIQSCKPEGEGLTGNVMVMMTIGSNGRVAAARVTTPKVQGTPAGSCIEAKVRAFRFPEFSGSPMQIRMPFSL